MKRLVLLTALAAVGCIEDNPGVDTVDAANLPDADPLQPDADPLQPDADPLRPDADPLQPDANPLQPDATPVQPDAAPPDAPPSAVCGDGTLTAPEICDDGNTTPGDGCSASCTVEPIACDGVVAPVVAPGDTVSGNTIGLGATEQGSCGGNGAPEQIYVLTIYQTLDVTLTTDLAGTSSDTVIYVRSDCANAMSEIGCDASGAPGDTLTLMGLAAGTYYVFVDGDNNESGAFQLEVSATVPPTCEELAETIAAGTPADTGTTVGLTDRHQPSCNNTNASGEASYEITVPAGNDLIVTATPTNNAVDGFDAVLSIETTCGDPATEVGCQDSPGADSAETITVLDAEGTYYIYVDGFDDTAGQYSIDVTLRSALCAGATTVASLPATLASTVAGTTNEVAPTCSGFDPGSGEDFYEITLTDTSVLDVSGTGLVATYLRAGSCNVADEIECDPAGGGLGFTTDPLPAGTYFLIVDGTGAYSIDVAATPVLDLGDVCTYADICPSGAYCIAGTCQTATFIPDNGGNQTYCTADGPSTGDTVYTGNVNNGTDIDIFELTLTATTTLWLETTDGAGGCQADTRVQLVAAGTSSCASLDMPPGPTPIADNDDGGIAPCSLLDPTTTSALVGLAAGTYYVRVIRGATTDNGPYVLTVDYR